MNNDNNFEVPNDQFLNDFTKIFRSGNANTMQNETTVHENPNEGIFSSHDKESYHRFRSTTNELLER